MKDIKWVREDLAAVKRAAAAGKTGAQLELSKRYLMGRDQDREPREGFIWASSAADRGDAEALHILGYCYATGTGVEPSGRKAFDAFVKSSLLGNAVATYNLAICYDRGIGCDRDYHLAYALYEKSAKMGYEKAKHIMAAKLWNRDTDDTQSDRRDIILAWYAARANKGDELASQNLKLVRKNKPANLDKSIQL